MSADKRRIFATFFKSKEQKQAEKEQRIKNAAINKIKKLDAQKKKIDEEIVKMGKYVIKDGKLSTQEDNTKPQQVKPNPFEEVPTPPQSMRQEVKRDLPIMDERELPRVQQPAPMPRPMPRAPETQSYNRYREPQQEAPVQEVPRYEEVPQHPRPVYRQPPMVAPPQEIPQVETYNDEPEDVPMPVMIPVTIKMVNGEVFEFPVIEEEMNAFLISLAAKIVSNEPIQIGKVIINTKHISFVVYE